MIVVHILGTIIGIIFIKIGFIIPEISDDFNRFCTFQDFMDGRINYQEYIDNLSKKNAGYYFMRVIWTIMWLISGLSLIVMTWFYDNLPELWVNIVTVGFINPILILLIIMELGCRS